ncbi:hypothetical protein BKA65DRAFT_595758 [Rhexocercosporidium sp. MPI-PUGE-AT-0058]|nr:hypothetical protein BKA65DRAFT_595758 [Rhexocercosporidium sp. MPI-PUGE-AT-0058]
MQFSITALVLALSALSTATVISERQRASPVGACCIANTSIKQEACTTAGGAAGRCVPGGNNCGGTLSCIATANLQCDAAVIERGKSLCRAKVAGGFQDGAKVITSLSQAKVN